MERRTHHRIKSFSVIGGFLDGLELAFADGLNCLIGHRGTGKTTVLEFIRFVLDAFGSGDAGATSRRRVEALVRRNLGDGRIRLAIETKDGLEYIVDRTASGEPMVLNTDGSPTNITIRSGGIFCADIFSQNEVENMADSGPSQRVLIDNFTSAEIADLNGQIAEVKSSLNANTNQILPAEAQLAALADELNTLPGVEAKIRALAGSGDDQDAEEVNCAHTDRALRGREKHAVSELSDLMSTYRDWFGNCAGRFVEKIRAIFADDILQGPNAGLLKGLYEDLAAVGDQIDRLFSQGTAFLDTGEQALAACVAALSLAHDKQELAFRDMIARHDKAQGIATERAGWERKRNDLLAKKRRYKELQGQRESLYAARQEMVARLQALYDQRFEIRRRTAEWISQNVASPIRVQVEQFGDRSAYRDMLKEMLKGAGVNHNVIARRIADLLPPRELISIVEKGMPEDLENVVELNKSQARKIHEALKCANLQLTMDVLELADLPSIELLDGGEYKNSLHLSTGQKCTTILPILLLDSDNPLLIDQPEDNLDNRFIYDTVVDSLRRVKARRQIILITHNPNIPVLGEAAMVAVLTSDGQQASIFNRGSVDDCKEEIINLLEGGREAFSQRKERYDY